MDCVCFHHSSLSPSIDPCTLTPSTTPAMFPTFPHCAPSEMAATHSRVCLICGVSIKNTNLGIDACRACAMFYKRHSSSEKDLLCRKGTGDCCLQSERPMCRKCRFERFAEILAQTNTETTNSDASDSIDIVEEEDDDEDSFVDHRSFDLFSSCSGDAPFFDRMKKAYSLLCLVRMCGESGIVTQNEEMKLQGDGMDFYPITPSVKVPALQMLAKGLIQFFESIFDDFNAISVDSKQYLLYRSIKTINYLDGLYRATHHFPELETLSPTYMSYVNMELVEAFAKQFVQDAGTDVLSELKRNFTNTISGYKRVDPSTEEFLAMMGLSLWSNDTSRLTDDYMYIVTANRSAIMSELHKYYTSRGMTDYSARLGEILCLLESIEKSAARTEQDILTVKLMSEEMSKMQF